MLARPGGTQGIREPQPGKTRTRGSHLTHRVPQLPEQGSTHVNPTDRRCVGAGQDAALAETQLAGAASDSRRPRAEARTRPGSAADVTAGSGTRGRATQAFVCCPEMEESPSHGRDLSGILEVDGGRS